MTVSQLFSSGPSYDDVDSAADDPIKNIPYCKNVRVDNITTVGEGSWVPFPGQNVQVGYLTCCAAVLIYDHDSNLILAGHPASGYIDENTSLDVDKNLIGFVIYATPDLKIKKPDFDDYRKSIDCLATKCGKEAKVCFLDGFRDMSYVFANLKGGLIFPKSLPKPPEKAGS